MPSACVFGFLPGPLGLFVNGRGNSSALAASHKPAPLVPAGESHLFFEPEPTSSWTPDLQMRDFSLAPLASGTPQLQDVRQGRTGNCPLIATLAALAHADPNRIGRMVLRRLAEVSSRVIDTDQTRPEFEELHYWSPYVFEVTFADGEPVHVSGHLWHRGGGLEFGRSERGDLWPSILEKAYVVSHGGNSYDKVFGALIPFEVMTTVLGKSKELVVRDSSAGALRGLLAHAGSKPTIADTLTTLPKGVKVPDGIIGFHTYAVRGMKGQGIVQVYDPLSGDTIDVPLATFQLVFETVVQAN